MTNNHSSHSATTSNITPLVSVVLPVYNGAAYLAESIQSILKQTYVNFELIIINDGSTDNSSEIIASFDDPRIRLYSQSNLGLPAALNKAIVLATSRYIARQDADDISLPSRLERQIEFLDNNPDCGIVGTWAEIIAGSRDTGRYHKHPIGNELLKFNLLFDSYFVHSSVMLTKSVFDKVGRYATEISRQPEDYELWSRIVRDGQFKVGNIPEIHIKYREVAGSICRTGLNPFRERVMNLCAENLAWASGRAASDPVITDIAALAHYVPNKLSPHPNFKAMRSVLQEAAWNVAGPLNGKTQMDKEIKRRYRSIKYNYMRMMFDFISRKVI
jgi:glycosyltransferase involved in cell wall biosynthesis